MARKVVFDRERIIEKAFKMLKKEGMEAITAIYNKHHSRIVKCKK